MFVFLTPFCITEKGFNLTPLILSSYFGFCGFLRAEVLTENIEILGFRGAMPARPPYPALFLCVQEELRF